MATRKPANVKWTTKELDSIKEDWIGDSLNDSGGLVGEVRKKTDGSICVSFRYGFKLQGKKVWHYCGMYPDKPMSEIRQNRDEAKKNVKMGIDPRLKKITDKIENNQKQKETIAIEAKRANEAITICDMFNQWVDVGVKRKNDNKSIKQSFSKHILPAIGNVKVKELTENHLNKIYKALIKEGKNTSAFEISKDVNQMIRWAELRQPYRSLLINGNPASLVEINLLLPVGFTKIRERVLSIDEIKKLKHIFIEQQVSYNAAPNKNFTEKPLKKEVQIAMWLCLSTLCRIGELLMTEWAHIDFEKRTWFIPKENTKKSGKKDTRTDHTVYLSDFTLNQFKELRELTGDSKWVFPATNTNSHVCIRSASKQIGDRQIKFKARTKKLQGRVENNNLVLGDQEWTPHDLRRTGATIMQGLLGLNNGLLITDLCLHHKVITGSARHYLFEGYEGAMREAWQMLGQHLEIILSDEAEASPLLS